MLFGGVVRGWGEALIRKGRHENARMHPCASVFPILRRDHDVVCVDGWLLPYPLHDAVQPDSAVRALGGCIKRKHERMQK